MRRSRKTVPLIIIGKGRGTLYCRAQGNSSSRLETYSTTVQSLLHELACGEYRPPTEPRHQHDNAGHYHFEPTCIVIDLASFIDRYDEASAIVMAAPLVSVDLADDVIARLPEPGPIMRFALDHPSTQPYGNILRAHDAITAAIPDQPGPLDTVSAAALAVYYERRACGVGTLRDADTDHPSILWRDGGVTLYERREPEAWRARKDR